MKQVKEYNTGVIESHPWPPFIPANARLLMLGTFPPKPNRWSMAFYYPNKINDMWRIMGVIFHDDRDYFWIKDEQRFDEGKIKQFLAEKGIALWDTGMKVCRLKDNASDKFLEIVEPIDLAILIDEHPSIQAVVTAGEKATGVVAEIAGCTSPVMGQSVQCKVGDRVLNFYRMPSSSRAYPMSITNKAEFYRRMFHNEGLLVSLSQ